MSFLLIHSITFKPNKGRGRGEAGEGLGCNEAPRRRRCSGGGGGGGGARCCVCAQVTLLCHTQKASFSPPSAAFQPSGPRRAGSQNSGGLPAASPGRPGLWDVRRCQGKPRQTFPKRRGLGRVPGPRRACAPPAAPSSQGSGEPGWSRTSIPGGPPSPCSRGSRGSGAVRLPSRLEVAARRRALRSSAVFAHGSLQEGLREAASREGGERPEGGQEIGDRASFGEARGNYAPWLGGKPSGGRLQRAPWPGAQAVASWFCIWAEAPALVAAWRGCRFLAHPYFGHPPGDLSLPLRRVLALGLSPRLHANPLPGASAPVPNNLLRGLRFGKAPAFRLAVAGSPEAPGRQEKSLGFPASERQTLPHLLWHAVCFTSDCVPSPQGVLGTPALCPPWGLLT